MEQNKEIENIEDTYRLDEPYCINAPLIPRPRVDLSRPATKLERMYCWRYWINRILDPYHTRDVLDNVEYIPEFNAEWGENYRKKGRLGHKKYKKMVQNKKNAKIYVAKPSHL